MNRLTVSGSPHVHDVMSVKSVMWGVVISLIPAMMVSFWYFGLGAIFVTAVAIVSCLVFEYLIQKFLLKETPTITDGSAMITGILLAFNVPSSLPWWQIMIGSAVAIGIGKMSFGGLGKNPFNPALVGRVFLLISFPVDMTSWPTAIENRFVFFDAATGPTSLGVLKENLMAGETVPDIISKLPSYQEMFIGQMNGSLGEVSAFALLLGGIYMLYRKIITWHIPFSFVASAVIFSGILWMVNPAMYIDPMFHILAGGMLLGAIYMATDMVTSPMTPAGMLVFGVGCGLLTILIRVFGAYPEGVSFAILIMNAFVPLINRGFKPKRFGGK